MARDFLKVQVLTKIQVPSMTDILVRALRTVVVYFGPPKGLVATRAAGPAAVLRLSRCGGKGGYSQSGEANDLCSVRCFMIWMRSSSGGGTFHHSRAYYAKTWH